MNTFKRVKAEFKKYKITPETFRTPPDKLDEKTLEYLLKIPDLHTGGVDPTELESE